jgi:pyrroline-5-carboxylate reductase
LRIGFVGGGVMAEAMIKGVLSRELAAPSDVIVGEPIAERRETLASQYRVRVSAENRSVVEACDLAVIAIKPQQISEALGPLRGSVAPEAIVMSIAAGIRLGTVRDLLSHRAVARVMPNTPAQVGYGMSVWTATDETSEEQRYRVVSVLDVLGKTAYVDAEHYLDMATALSGSGPGYVLLFLEALIDAGVHIGLARPLAEEMAKQTLLGTAVLADQSSDHPAQLRNLVTSPGGTTAEGLLELEAGGLRAVIVNAVTAAYEKSKALG